jgi:succinyl-CoA synthetase beta subunit
VIRLFEYEGKSLLARNGLRIPLGSLYPEPPPQTGGKFVVKAQVLAGGRGKAGGIKFADSVAEAQAAAKNMLGAKLGVATVAAVYVEERLQIAREYYLCAIVDRDLGMPVILASREGGVEIETVAAEKILRRPVDPLLGLRPFVVDEIVRFLQPPAAAVAHLREAVAGLYAALLNEDAELLEINPLALLNDNTIVAADAKCVLDEDAAYRHAAREHRFDGTPFEIAARQLGTIGIELEGNIAAIMNGAGMTMATLDQIIALGGQIGALVELHGAMAHGPERIAEIIELVGRQKPAAILLNVYFQFRPLDTIAKGLLLARDRGWLPEGCGIIVRFRGEMEAEARTMLAGFDCTLTGVFEEACALAVDSANAAPPRERRAAVAT